ncbi:MAG: SIR2 family protein [Elusimicrobiaceae bacterium]|nr:SIR2 family protein [Elusimicrobiaceae bacterium]
MAVENKFDLIPAIPSELLSQFLNDNVIVFVGNGISRLAGVPSWRELALRYLENWFEKGNLSYDAYNKLKDESDPLTLLTICAGKLGKDELKNELYARLTQFIKQDSEEEKKILRIYRYIRDFHAGYITTNYDDYLEMSTPTSEIEDLQGIEFLQPYKINLQKTLNRLGLNDKMEKARDSIVYLHGKASKLGVVEKDAVRNDIILTLEDYLEHYKDDDGLGKTFLSNVFANHVFLFIGFGLKEFEIIQHIRRPDNSHSHYILLGVSDYEYDISDQYRNYYSILNITPVFYSTSQKGYAQLEDVLREWSLNIRTARMERLKNLQNAEQKAKNLENIRRLGNGTFR